jgi:hypothetical protein
MKCLRPVLVGLLWNMSHCFAQAPTVGNCPVFPADNIWNTPVDQLPVSPNSSTYVNTIGATVHVHPDFGTVYDGAPNGIPYLAVPGTQTKYPATFTYASESDPGPYATPLNAPIEGGSQSTGDRHVISVDTGNCILYELYAAYPQTASWQAGSGAIFNLLSNNLRPATWTSADAAGLPIFPGLVRYDEILAGEIRHALRFTVPHTQRAYVWPARHYASSLTGIQYPPMGVRFRLRADYDISGFSAANQTILRALKKYGMMIADNGSAWYISGAPDSRWDDSDLHNLSQVTGAAFEVIDVSSLMVSADSGQARQANVTVAVTPPIANVGVNGTRQFNAAVQNSTNPFVNWSINGTDGNSVVGWISATGLYTAPAVAPTPPAVTITAASQAAPSAIGTASVTIVGVPADTTPPVVSLTPIGSASVQGTITIRGAATDNIGVTRIEFDVDGVLTGTVFTSPFSFPWDTTAAANGTHTLTVKAYDAANNVGTARESATVSNPYQRRGRRRFTSSRP